ncbi:MAG TPA: hypothetical protein VEP46_13150 [Vicinamibacterales bacterium]|nr:hypothetical protein [Vicinamibacterales bacterium]
MIEISDLPALNATLNGISAILLTAGYVSIRARAAGAAQEVHAGGTGRLDGVPYVVRHLPRAHRIETISGAGAAYVSRISPS